MLFIAVISQDCGKIKKWENIGKGLIWDLACSLCSTSIEIES